MDVNVAPHSINITEPVESRLAARQPQNAREHPVSIRIPRAEIIGIAFAGRAPADKYRVHRNSTADFGPDNVTPAGRAITAVSLAGAVFRR